MMGIVVVFGVGLSLEEAVTNISEEGVMILQEGLHRRCAR